MKCLHFVQSLQARPGHWLALLVLILGLFASISSAQISPLRPDQSAPDLVLEREDWIILQPLSMEEILRHQMGIVISRRGGLGSPEFVNVAGSVVGRLRVVVDGIEYNEPELQWPRLSAIQVSSIERIELHRTSDPARLEIWTRPPHQEAPVTEIDVGMGDLGTRSQRVQFMTPARAVRVGVRFEELRRGRTDFRRNRFQSAPEFFGSYNGRGLAIEAEFQRPAGESLVLRHQRFTENAHGSFQSLADFSHTLRALNGLRWQRSLAGVGMWFDVSHLVWDHDRRLDGLEQQVSESHARLALDLELPRTRGWQPDLRMRLGDRREELSDPSTFDRNEARQYDLELQASRQGSIAWTTWLGAHRQSRWGNGWSARLRASWAVDQRTTFVQVGRGLSFAGIGEHLQDRDEAVRTGTFAAAGHSRAGESVHLLALGYYKHLEAVPSGARTFFPELRSGPTGIGGILASVSLIRSSQNYLYDLGARMSWRPYLDGDAGGLPMFQAEVSAQLSRREWFQGDLMLALENLWHFQSPRRFTGTLELPGFVVGDLILNARVLQRILIFWKTTNLLDTLYDSSPGVLMPGRSSQVGLRVSVSN